MITTEEEAKAWLSRLHGYEGAAAKLEMLVRLLVDENTRQNLVSAASLQDVWARHIVDSAQLLVHAPAQLAGPWLDLGTGAGFPGLVIAAIRPDLQVVMVESRPRRVDWLCRAIAELGLDKARVEGRRLEAMDTLEAGVISARAFAPLDKLLTISARFSTADTVFLLPKGRSARQELDELRKWRHVFHVEPSVTDSQAGIIVGSLLDGKGGTR